LRGWRARALIGFDALPSSGDAGRRGLGPVPVTPMLEQHSTGDAERMGIFRRNVPSHYIPIHPDNIMKKDWIILLEAGTIVGPSPEKLRVAKATLERKIVRKYNIFLRKKHYLVLDGYDARIHALYFCPQLYKFDSDNHNLVALEGEEIGSLLAQSLQNGVVDKQPWYEPSKQLPRKPVITTVMQSDFDTVVVDAPEARSLSEADSSAKPLS
jgi:hypothetical protein